jgi:DNA transposition AAA+ family ATPase
MTQKIAMTTNVGLCVSTIDRIMTCAEHLDRMAVFFGYSGVGKSTAASIAANQYRAYYVQCKSNWTRKAFLVAILKEMGIEPAKTLYDMTDQISEQLVLSARPLIVDEFDYLVEKKMIETVRDIYEGSHAPILLIGEQKLPDKIKRSKWERFYGRVLVWSEAKALTLADVRELAAIYTAGIEIADDLLTALHTASAGSARLTAVNLDGIRDYCARTHVQHIALTNYKQPLVSGNAARRA